MGGERSSDASAPAQQRAVSLWDLLTVLAGTSALGGALGAAATAHLSGLPLVLSAAGSLLLGFASTALVRIGGGRLVDRTTSPPALGLIYAGATLRLFGAAVIAFAVMRGLVALLA